MTLLDKPNGCVEPVTRAWDTRLARIEQRIAKSEESQEQRILILRDAMADFAADFVSNRLTPLHDENKTLKKEISELKRQLQEKLNLDQRIEEVMKRRR